MSENPPAPLQDVSITVAPNGGRRSKADHPALPLTVPELVRTAAECLAAGAAMLHLHIRDAQGGHLLDSDDLSSDDPGSKSSDGRPARDPDHDGVG